MTAPALPQLPAGWKLLWRESNLSQKFGRTFSWLGTLSEYVLRIYVVLVLLRRRRHYDVIVTGRYGEFFALAQGLIPFGRRPHILLDIEWWSTHRADWRGKLNRLLHRRIAGGAGAIQVFCRIEANNYATRFGIPREKFAWIPYCFALPDSVTDGGAEGPFIFSGGVFNRDFATLFAAVKGLPVQLVVAAPRAYFANVSVPENVTILGQIPTDEYWQRLSDARFVVVSLDPGLTRCPGVVTYVGAMRMGKCVVVNEPYGAADYIEHGTNGFIVPPRDVVSLRDQIVSLLANDRLACTVGARAKLDSARQFSPAAYLNAIETVAHRLADAA